LFNAHRSLGQICQDLEIAVDHQAGTDILKARGRREDHVLNPEIERTIDVGEQGRDRNRGRQTATHTVTETETERGRKGEDLQRAHHPVVVQIVMMTKQSTDALKKRDAERRRREELNRKSSVLRGRKRWRSD